MKKKYYSLIACVFFLLSFISYAHTALYKWVDKDGQIHITDYPDPNRPGEVEIIEEPVQKPAPLQQPPIETEPISPPPSEIVSPVPEPSKEIAPLQPAPLQQPETKMPAITPPQTPVALPAMPKIFPVPGQPPEFPVSIAFIFVIFLIMYLYASFCLFLIAKKLGVRSPVFAWIPLVQVWTFAVAAKGKDGHPFLWILAMIIPVIGPLVGIYLWMCIAENLGKNKWLALLMLIPIVGFVIMGWLAFSKGEVKGEQVLTSNI